MPPTTMAMNIHLERTALSGPFHVTALTPRLNTPLRNERTIR